MMVGSRARVGAPQVRVLFLHHEYHGSRNVGHWNTATWNRLPAPGHDAAASRGRGFYVRGVVAVVLIGVEGRANYAGQVNSGASAQHGVAVHAKGTMRLELGR